MNRFLLSLVLVASACRDLEDPDAAAGSARPGYVAFRVAPPVGVALTSASTSLGDALYTDCTGVEVAGPGGASVDLGLGTLVELEVGDWCGLQFDLAEPIVATGISQGGLPWSMALDVLVVSVGNGVPFKILRDNAYTFELAEPGWFRAADLAPEDTAVTSVTIDGDHPSHGHLSGAIAQKSALLLDQDADGRVDDAERATGMVARGSERALVEAR